MKHFLIIAIVFNIIAAAQELKIVANSFHADEKKGLSVFEGNVMIIKHNDELNASKVTVYTDANNKPIKFVAFGNASFQIETVDGAKYKGKANKVIYYPIKKEYHFFQNVHLNQINEKKEIIGDEVILKTVDGTAYAKGLKKEPVIMIFNIEDEEEKK